MSIFSSISDVIGSVSNYGELRAFCKDARSGSSAAAANVSGQMTSLWQYNGVPSDGIAPTTVAAPTNLTTGSLRYSNASGGRSKYLLHAAATCGAAGTLILYDRLLHIGGLSATTTTPQTVAGSLTRNTGGLGNQIWAEIYTQIGATGTTITASYTNETGASGHTTQAATFGNTGFREVQRMIQMPLASGDAGVQVVASCTVLASTLTAGNFGITVLKQLVAIPLGLSAAGSVLDFASGPKDFPLVEANSCLAWMILANTTTVPQLYGTVQFTEK